MRGNRYPHCFSLMATDHLSLNILVVEDNNTLREAIVDALSESGYHVRGIDCAEALAEQRDLTQLDLAILDLNLPGEDGLSLASRLRSGHPALGIIMLTARIQSEDRAAGYAQGADIYLSKPASFAELKQAIQALARRLKRAGMALATSAICLDTHGHRLIHPDGQKIPLTTHETALLTAFTRSAQNILETWQIAELLGMDAEQSNKPAIELHIVRLRKKLLPLSAQNTPIRAIRGRGYQLCLTIRIGST